MDVGNERRAYADASLDLLARFMEMVFDDISILDEIPAQATLFLIPEVVPDASTACKPLLLLKLWR